MALTADAAEKALQAAKAKATELDARATIAIVDARGDLVALLRLDGARWYTPGIAQGKAMASATFGRPSGEMSERADSPVMRSMLLMNDGRMVLGQGAVPIMDEGAIQGAIGVSGGTAQQDEDIAQAGVDAI